MTWGKKPKLKSYEPTQSEHSILKNLSSHNINQLKRVFFYTQIEKFVLLCFSAQTMRHWRKTKHVPDIFEMLAFCIMPDTRQVPRVFVE